MAPKGIRIDEDVCKGVCGALFALAILVAATRILIRVRMTRRLALDDYLLLVACVFLGASTGLLYELIPSAYLFERLLSGEQVPLPFPVMNIEKEEKRSINILDVYVASSWAVIYGVKFSYLAFFRALIDRIQPMIIYWKIVVVITFLSAGVAVYETFIACPQQSIVIIPIGILWNVRIKLRQKLGIGAFLCLSVVLIIVAIIKIAGIRSAVDSFDLVWEMFWQQVEACTAVSMVSLTAFRSIFLSKKQKRRRNSGRSDVSRFWSWLSPKRGSKNSLQHQSPSDRPDQPLPQVTLGTRFHSGRDKGLLESQIQPTSRIEVPTYPQDLQKGWEEEINDLETLATHDSGTSLTAVADDGSSKHVTHTEMSVLHTPGEDEENHRNHWWQRGIISNFTLSRAESIDSERRQS